MTTANKITILRIALIPVLIICFLVDFKYHYLVSGLIYIVCAVTDSLDGALARRTSTVTNLGKILDPIADKALSITAMILCVCYELFYFNVACIVMVSLMIFRELFISVMRMLALYQGKALAADAVGKFKTIFLNISMPVLIIVKQFEQFKLFHSIFAWIGFGTFVVAFVLTLVSGVRYVVINAEVFRSLLNEHSKNDPSNEEAGEEK